MAIPVINNQPVKGSNITIKIPSPKPIKQTANVFFKNLKFIKSLQGFTLLHYYMSFIFLCELNYKRKD